MPASRGASIFLLVVIGLAALWFRASELATTPPGMFRDELEKGYTALELWETGRHGVFHGNGIGVSSPMPLFIDVFGDRTSAIYQYLTAPIVGAFGLNRTTTRAVAAGAGMLAVLLAGALGFAWHGNRGALLAAMIAAAMPQAIVFSRWAQQGSLVPMFVLAGVLVFWLAFWREAKERRGLAAIAGAMLGIAFYAYDPVRPGVSVLIVALVLGIPRAKWRELRAPMFVFALAFLAIAVPVFLYAITGEGSSRFRRVSVFADGIGPGVLTAAWNYIRHFDPRFLFLSGDANPRHGMPWCGLVSVLQAPFVIAGIYSLVRCGDGSPETRARRFAILALVLGAPLGAAFTRAGIPHALRSILFVPGLVMLAAESARCLPEVVEGRARYVRAGALLLAIFSFWHARTGLGAFATNRPDAWQAGVLEGLATAAKDYPASPIYLSSDIPYAPYFALFAEQPAPADFHERGFLALKTRILAPGASPESLARNAVLVAPDPSAPMLPEGHPPVVLMMRGPGGE